MNLRITRRGAAAMLASSVALAHAEDKPIEWVVGYAAGGGSDVVARIVAEPMTRSFGRSIIVNNKPGGATDVAADHVAKSRDVGNVMPTADFATPAANPGLFAKLPFDPERDFKSIGLLERFPLILVVTDEVPAKTWKEFAAGARSRPEGVSYGAAGAGSPHHLATELLRERSGPTFTHIPHHGAAPAVQDLIGGQISIALINANHIRPD